MTSALEVFGRMRRQWRALHVADGYDPTDPMLRPVLDRITDDARRALNTLHRQADRTFLWEDARVEEHRSFAISRSFDRLYRMALAWATPGSGLYGDAGLLRQTIAGLDWMVAHDYRDDATIVGNWFEWQIAGPTALHDTACLLYDRLSPERLRSYARSTAHFVPTVQATAANRALLARVVVGRGILIGDEQTVDAGVDGLAEVLSYTDAGDGFHPDGSFLQHEAYAYAASYGNLLLGALPMILRTVAETPRRIDASIVFEWLRDAWDPLMWQGAMMDLASGRTISRFDQQDHEHGHEALAAALQLLPCAPAEIARWAVPMVKEWLLSDRLHAPSGGLEDHGIPVLLAGMRLRDDASVPPRGPLVTSHVFGRMARVVHRRQDWAIGISMSSPTVATNETINDENRHGWLVDHGATYLYTRQSDHFADGWWPTVDPRRIPGTTVDVRDREDAEGSGYRNPHSWVGGATLDRRYTAAGTRIAVQGSSLEAYKSWFCFDREIVAMGTGITASDGRAVETIVENRRLATGDEVVLADGRAVVSRVGETKTLRSPSWVHLEGTGGYVFGNPWEGTVEPPTRVRVRRETRTGRWSDINRHPLWSKDEPLSRHYVTLWLDHGVDPTDAEYIYTVLPAASEVETAMYARRLETAVVVNRPEVQAVRELGSGVFGVNAWQAASASIVHCGAPASVVVREGADELALAVADPTQEASRVRLRVDVEGLDVRTAHRAIRVVSLAPLVIDVDVEGAGGASREIRLAYRPWAVEDLRALVDSLRASDDIARDLARELDEELCEVAETASAGGPAVGLLWTLRARLKTRRARGLSDLAFDAVDDGAQRLFARLPGASPRDRVASRVR